MSEAGWKHVTTHHHRLTDEGWKEVGWNPLVSGPGRKLRPPRSEREPTMEDLAPYLDFGKTESEARTAWKNMEIDVGFESSTDEDDPEPPRHRPRTGGTPKQETNEGGQATPLAGGKAEEEGCCAAQSSS